MNLQDILLVEKSINDWLQEVRNAIAKEINETEITGVKRINNFCAVIRFSDLQNNVWTPEYYMPYIQAVYVTTALESAKNAADFTKKIESMIAEKRVKIGQNIHYLNDTTVSILVKHYQNNREG